MLMLKLALIRAKFNLMTISKFTFAICAFPHQNQYTIIWYMAIVLLSHRLSRGEDSNLQSSLYKSVALPLSYPGVRYGF